MEQMLHLATSIYTQHMPEIMLGLLVCLVLLMIMNMFAVRRCRKQIKNLNDRTKEAVRLSLKQGERNGRERRDRVLEDNLRQERGGQKPSPEDEEIFGSVIREIFS